MSKIINKISSIGRSLGLFSVMATMAFALLAAPAAPAAAASSDPVPSPTSGGTIVTSIFNRLNGRPIAGAAVVIVNSAGVQVATGVTPATGSLRFSLRPGEYKLSVKASGFANGGTLFKVFAGQLSAVRVGLNSIIAFPQPTPTSH